MQGKLSHGMENLLFQLTADLKTLFPISNSDTIVYVQNDSFNCGVHVCAFAKQMASKSLPYQLHPNINAFRKHIYDAIVGGCLKWSKCGPEQCPECQENYFDQKVHNRIWISCRKCEQWYHKEFIEQSSSSDFVCPVS
jgi:hypothetical protein